MKIVLARIFIYRFSLRERPLMSKRSCVSSEKCRRHDFANGRGLNITFNLIYQLTFIKQKKHFHIDKEETS